MTEKEECYSISKFGKLTGLSPYTLRYYEREGLIIPQRDKNDRRYYTKQDIGWIGFLLHLKGTGMSMNEIKKYVELRAQGDNTISQRKELLQQVQTNSLSRINEMKMHLEVLNHKIDWYEGKLDHSISEEFADYLKRFE
ncbi:MerR family transcriptional regulator [Fructilactobacillus lindneri]|uniref:MerR family transcriptional regulator n=1 Tax=Fructilactobacillus lindneri TaxID=53444 RepID=A0AB33BCZ4_9LACO|nr:MerR family transcriptional regulator [Fructilactobacillus lindneri]POH23632.1 MerR family transcriptional regulator [Fructilactobacillus lindneri DSM 20690 = JCM 11027]ANZ59816.1 MerR family transcriptional regulator [Fructilactobacillus lindneri]POG97777.1 MerR family transcriptional regulator [Fructilactobacillus lindneri]POH00104.1 MerR family transcriptional regulator [Fructilactobacillus lindneri]